MPFAFNHAEVCSNCPHGSCFEDRRNNPIRGRNTLFRFRQHAAVNCTFDEFMPGSGTDPDPDRTYETYLKKFRNNVEEAGKNKFGDAFVLQSGALAKVEGDIFELLEAGVLWNVAAAWNRFMDSGLWDSNVFNLPAGSVPIKNRKIAIFQLPRGYDATKLFKLNVRSNIKSFENNLKDNGMILGLSSPDIVGVRLPDPLPDNLKVLLNDINDLGASNLFQLENAHKLLENSIDGSDFLFAVAVKRTIRSDRLYQPLFEANILKYLIKVVLKGGSFRFYAHLNSFEGADVQGHYRAASLVSLMSDEVPSKAVDCLYLAEKPRETAQAVLNDFPNLPW